MSPVVISRINCELSKEAFQAAVTAKASAGQREARQGGALSRFHLCMCKQVGVFITDGDGHAGTCARTERPFPLYRMFGAGGGSEAKVMSAGQMAAGTSPMHGLYVCTSARRRPQSISAELAAAYEGIDEMERDLAA